MVYEGDETHCAYGTDRLRGGGLRPRRKSGRSSRVQSPRDRGLDQFRSPDARGPARQGGAGGILGLRVRELPEFDSVGGIGGARQGRRRARGGGGPYPCAAGGKIAGERTAGGGAPRH